MALPNIFTKEVSDTIIQRIEKLTPNTPGQWGKMDVARMLAHCNVTYEMAFENKHSKPGLFMRLMLKAMVKPKVVGEESYPKNSRTAPQFVMTEYKNYEQEKARLLAYVKKTQELGEAYFEGKESHSFGKHYATEWNNMFYKHLEHHLSQFGV